ncbi:hypothetical protein [Pontibacter anaerobius]|uniref:Uncharacterized protein n=1 Tax=Pontibacter anaerobius TaxID=2993940 RepID=A0ABT3RFX5_9BACT|nr:hypothetical protein [Pontibacter anaerobius]MCX2740257.1 hypothetical protein [Pontibacter anaerobius]
MNFEPPIAERETDELIQIVNFPDDWNPVAVEQARAELLARNISPEYNTKKVAVLKRYKQKKREFANKRKANEGYHWEDFIFSLDDVLVEMLFDWDMKKDGYLIKHRQRKYSFFILAILILTLCVYWNLVK